MPTTAKFPGSDHTSRGFHRLLFAVDVMQARGPKRPATEASQPALAPGTIFQGGYEILSSLGAGTFGWVFRARQLSTGQDVAIKVLRLRSGGAAADAENHAARFRREMRVCAGLSHPNIVRLIDSGETEGGLLYAVFEYVPGETLKEVLDAEGKLSLRETLHLMTQVLDALSCAHARGVVHRDLKPENIMVTKTGVRRNALVLDFGLGGFTREAEAWALPRLTATHELMGTPCYAAPEQLRGEPPTTRSDLYSWGLTFLECLTGERAVQGGSVHEVIMRQLGPEPVPIPPPLRHQPLGRVLEVVIAKQVEKRDVTIEGLLEGLAGLETPPAHADGGQPRPPLSEGERRQVTIVSVRLAMKPVEGRVVDVEEVDELLHAGHALVGEIAARYGGRPTSALADRIVLVFGHPKAREDDARRAVRAALAIVAEMERSDRRLAVERGAQVEAHLGVHTGVLIVRELRQGIDRGLYDLVGLTPQVAARLDEQAGPGEVLASEDTRRLLRDAFTAERTGVFRLAELSRPLTVFRLGARREGTGLETVPRVQEAPLVGRELELRRLVGLWERAQDGRAGAVLITGEPGIGKSRLARELRRRVAAEAWLEAHCVAEYQESPLRPLLELLLALGQPLDVLLARHGFDLAETMPLFATLLPEPAMNTYPPLPLTPDRLRELTLATLLSLFMRMAQERPIVLAVEDLQWADPTTVELLGQILQELRTAQLVTAEAAPRLCVVLTARPEFSPPWSLEDVLLIQPPRLGRDDVERMVTAELAAGDSLPATLLERVVQHADGVPLFVEEVVCMLVESGALRDLDELADGLGLQIPSGLRDLLTARLDLLSASARGTIQLAATLGREFRYELLQAVACRDESLLRDDVRELLDAGLLYARRSVRAETYLFKHALIRDAAYASMTRPKRRELHLRIARSLRERFPDVEQDRPEILAQHYERGGDLETGVHYWKGAGDRTMARGAYVESISIFEHGVALLRDLPASRARTQRELALTESLGMALFLTRGWTAPEVEPKFAHALALCDELGGDVPIRVLFGMWAIRAVRSDRDAASRLCAAVQRRAAGSEDDRVRHAAHAWAGVMAFYGGDFPRARDEMTTAAEWSKTEGFKAFVREYGYDATIDVFAFLMWSLWLLGYPDRALDVSNEMRSIAERGRYPFAVAMALGYSANLARDRGETERVLELTQRSIAFANEQKLYFWLGPAMCTRGWALAQQGSLEEGVALIRRGLGIYDAIGVRSTYAYHLSGLIEAQLVSGAAAEALPPVREAIAQCETLLDCFYEAELRRLEGELLRVEGREEEAEASFRAALALANRQSAKSFELRAATSLARLLRERGTCTEARTVLADVYGWFTEGLETRDLRTARTLLAQIG